MAVVDNKHALTRHPVLNPQFFSRLDRAVFVVVIVLLALIIGTILLGDRVGVQLAQVAPLGTAHSTSAISIHFSEVMDRASAEAHFRIDPALRGATTWNGSTMIFRPGAALEPGSIYTVFVEPGAQSETGRLVLSEYRYSFTVAHPRVAYLYPANGSPQNLWLVDPADPEHPAQITNSPTGIQDFDVSPDGTRIAFTENNPILATSDIKLLDLESGGLEQLTNCQNSLCSAPNWRPEGKVIAYQRIENDEQFGSSPPRIWLLDLSTKPATTRPLFQENQILGYDAEWSADGNRIALVNRSTASILIYDFTTDKIVSVDSQAGATGTLSPDGKTLVYPELIFAPTPRNVLRVFRVDTGEFASLTDPNDSVDDQNALWSPDGTELAVAREDSRMAAGAQIVLVNMETHETRQLTDDPRYSNLSFWWNPTGSALLVQRFPELDQNMQLNANGLPEIWTIDVATGEGMKIADNGFLPRWVP